MKDGGIEEGLLNDRQMRISPKSFASAVSKYFYNSSLGSRGNQLFYC